MSKSQLWEILVPTQRNCGKPFRTRHHREWDKQVRKISGGLTIFQPAKGQWVSPHGKLFVDRMIPVRIIATETQMKKIVNATLKHYDQEAVLAYRLSEEILLLGKDGKPLF